MRLWQKNLIAVLAVSVLVLAAMCALLIVDDNRGRLEGEREAARRDFRTALTALENSAALYPQDRAERQRAVIRSLQVTSSLGGRGQWLLTAEGEPVFGQRANIPLDVLPTAGEALFCALYPGWEGPVLVCAQKTSEYTLYGAWEESSLWAGGRSRAARMGIMLAAAAVVLAVLLFLLSQRMFRPLNMLEKSAQAVAAGDYDRRVPPSGVSDLDALGKSFNEMAASVRRHIDALERENQQQRRFVANLAHEMKTPMTAMIGYSDLLLGERVPEAQRREAYQYISQQARRLNELSHKLTALSGLERREELAFLPLSLKRLLEEAVGTVRPLAEKKGVHILPPRGDAPVLGEETLLISLLTNLLTNACKASPADGEILCTAGRKEGGTFAAVTDQGAGVPEESLPLLTEPFYMVDKSRARKENGAGIGLALCKEIARLHGGKMEFENLRPGFRVTLWLPDNLQNDDMPNTD